MSYSVYTAEYLGAPNRVAIFIKVSGDYGLKYHVIGNILLGMEYQTRRDKVPDSSPTFVPGTQKLIGQIRQTDVARFEALCLTVPPPGPQLLLNGKPKDRSKPLRRCGEWVNEVVAKALSEGVITR